MLTACLAVSLFFAAGCNRQDPEPARPARIKAPQAKPRIVQVESTQPALPERSPVEAGALKVEIDPLSNLATAMQPETGSNKEAVDAFFERPTVLRIQIQIPPAGLDVLRRTHWEGQQKRPEAKAVVREGGRTYSDVAVHLKGSAGSFRSVDNRPCLTLNFDEFVDGQSFHGLHKISLNNSVQDSSYLCEIIARELFIAAGVPVPRATHALVTLNGRDLGLYVLLEGANRQFLKRYFSNAKGNLYDGGFCQDISTSLAVNCGEDPKNKAGLKALMAAINDSRPTLARLEKVLDVERFLSMVALETMLCHWDGYTQNRNNWRIFHDLESNKMVFIPHGLDQLFGVGRHFDPAGSLKPQNVSGTLTRIVLASREGQQRYLERVQKIYSDVFKVDEILSRVDHIVSTIVPIIAQTHPQIAKALQQRAGSLKQRILQRGEGLRRQLGIPIQPVEFSHDNILRLTGWKPSPVQSGEPTLAQVEDPPGNPLLSINAGNAISSSSWRTRVVLATGRYQLEGRIRVRDVAIEDGDARGGAGMRISKGTMPRKLTGTSDWRNYEYPFTVEEETADVELICELRALQGEACFEAKSLRLVRLREAP
jgi:spore coat protein H